MGLFIDLTGKQFGRWTVLSRERTAMSDAVQWRCRCSCGTLRTLTLVLRYKRSRSCGCLKRELAWRHNTTHRHATAGPSSTYSAWIAMIARGNASSNAAHAQDGRRGSESVAGLDSACPNASHPRTNNGLTARSSSVPSPRQEVNPGVTERSRRMNVSPLSGSSLTTSLLVDLSGTSALRLVRYFTRQHLWKVRADDNTWVELSDSMSPSEEGLKLRQGVRVGRVVVRH